MKKEITFKILIFSLIFLQTGSSCKKRTSNSADKTLTEAEITILELQWLADEFLITDDVSECRQFANLAINKWQNGVVDREPILIYNQIRGIELRDGPNRLTLTFWA